MPVSGRADAIGRPITNTLPDTTQQTSLASLAISASLSAPVLDLSVVTGFSKDGTSAGANGDFAACVIVARKNGVASAGEKLVLENSADGVSNWVPMAQPNVTSD